MNKNFLVACIAIAVFGFNAEAQKKEKAPTSSLKQKSAEVNDNKIYDEFLKRNPTIKSLYWKGTGQIMGVRLKSGKEEVYNLENENELAAAEAKYGTLPAAPPPPPPIPAKPSKPKSPEIPNEPSIEEPAPPTAPGKPGDYLPPKKPDVPNAPKSKKSIIIEI